MKEIATIEAILLSKKKLGEGDLICDLLCQNGKLLSLKIHGIRKSKKRSQLTWSIGNKLKIQYYPKLTGLASLKNAQLLQDYYGLNLSWTELQYLSYIIELASVSKIHNNANLYVLLDGTLNQFRKIIENRTTQVKSDLLLLAIFYRIKLIKYWGILGSTELCSICDSKIVERSHWQFPDCSFTCSNCNESATTEGYLLLMLFRLMSSKRFSLVMESDLILKNKTNPNLNTIYVDFNHRLHLSLEAFIGKNLKSGSNN